MIEIRPVEEPDVEVISAILCASIRQLCGRDHENDPIRIRQWLANKTPESIAAWLANPQLILFLALHDGHPGGVGGFFDHGELVLNYVDPAHRFCGVSRAILAHFETECARRGLRKAMLASTETAHQFYRAAGWRDVGETGTKHGVVSYSMEKAFVRA